MTLIVTLTMNENENDNVSNNNSKMEQSLGYHDNPYFCGGHTPGGSKRNIDCKNDEHDIPDGEGSPNANGRETNEYRTPRKRRRNGSSSNSNKNSNFNKPKRRNGNSGDNFHSDGRGSSISADDCSEYTSDNDILNDPITNLDSNGMNNNVNNNNNSSDIFYREGQQDVSPKHKKQNRKK